MAQFNEGDEVYSTHGDLAVYIKPFNGRHIVSPITFDHNGEEHCEDVETWYRVYSQAPVKRLADDHAAILEQINTAKLELDAIKKEHQSVLTEIKEKQNLMKKIPDLSRIMDFHEGKITHMITKAHHSYGSLYKMELLSSALKGDNCESGKLKLLSLFGGSNGDYQYMINRYSDGSGGNHDCWPVCGEDEGRNLIKSFIEKEIVKNDTKDIKRLMVIQKECEKYSIDFPQNLIEIIKQAEFDSANRNLETIATKFNEARDELIKLSQKYGDDND